MPYKSYYALDAAVLLEQCKGELEDVLLLHNSNNNSNSNNNNTTDDSTTCASSSSSWMSTTASSSLVSLKHALDTTEMILRTHVEQILLKQLYDNNNNNEKNTTVKSRSCNNISNNNNKSSNSYESRRKSYPQNNHNNNHPYDDNDGYNPRTQQQGHAVSPPARQAAFHEESSAHHVENYLFPPPSASSHRSSANFLPNKVAAASSNNDSQDHCSAVPLSFSQSKNQQQQQRYPSTISSKTSAPSSSLPRAAATVAADDYIPSFSSTPLPRSFKSKYQAHGYCTTLVLNECRSKHKAHCPPPPPSLSCLISLLRPLVDEKKRHSFLKQRQSSARNLIGCVSHCYFPTLTRTAMDTLLFRLIVVLQLCLVRMDNAKVAITGTSSGSSSSKSKRRYSSEQTMSPYNSFHEAASTATTPPTDYYYYGEDEKNDPSLTCSNPSEEEQNNNNTCTSKTTTFDLVSSTVTSSVGLFVLAAARYCFSERSCGGSAAADARGNSSSSSSLVWTVSKAGAVVLSTTLIRMTWNKLTITKNLLTSAAMLEEWNQNWMALEPQTAAAVSTYNNKDSSLPHNNNNNNNRHNPISTTRSYGAEQKNGTIHMSSEFESCRRSHFQGPIDTEKTRRLVEYALNRTHKSSEWHSKGELRFLMLKRAMDAFYASVGSAMRNPECDIPQQDWTRSLLTGAATSFFSLTGATQQAIQVTSSSSASTRSMIMEAWGLVSLPSIKNLSLQASKLTKGAAIVARIELCGVSCYVLSADPVPEIFAAVDSFQRKYRRKKVQTMMTLDEEVEVDSPLASSSPKSLSRSGSKELRQRDVILHLTGGGFFSHVIASDIPWLLDWSAATGAVVICPEYALLPEQIFPVALNQVTRVYKALVTSFSSSNIGEFAVDAGAGNVLGFEPHRVAVTGDSVGGNLAAALCVKLCMENAMKSSLPCLPQNQTASLGSKLELNQSFESEPLPLAASRLPDALVLSTPVLNLSLDLSPSGMMGTVDSMPPTNGLLSSISDAYIPTKLGISKTDPLVSPSFASDEVLRQFPPTFQFASSSDPLLDDSVAFQQRLERLGVKTELRVTPFFPHSYLGLGTAGFPEQPGLAQEECRQWLAQQFAAME